LIITHHPSPSFGDIISTGAFFPVKKEVVSRKLSSLCKNLKLSLKLDWWTYSGAHGVFLNNTPSLSAGL
jgi:hypothetical protein